MSSKLYGSSPATASALTLDMHNRMGGVLISNTAVVTGRFCEVYALSATVVASLVTENSQVNGGGIWNAQTPTSLTTTAVPIPAGGNIKGNITSITLTSGTVIAYHAP